MAHPLIDQFRFTRNEWLRGLAGVSEEEAAHHFGPMNCISWTVGHLAWHEHRYWLELAQGKMIFPELNEMYAYGAPMSTPSARKSHWIRGRSMPMDSRIPISRLRSSTTIITILAMMKAPRNATMISAQK